MSRPNPRVRTARADALHQLVAQRGGRLLLNRKNLAELEARGFTRAAAERAVDDLADTGRVTVRADRGDVVVIAREDA